MRIDAHQHFWRLDRGDYGWLTPALAPIYRDFQPTDLEPLLRKAGIEGTILVQAAPSVAESRYMLSLATEHDFIKGVVGWVDFESPAAPNDIADLAADPKLVGLRPMIQDIADDDWMLRPDLAPAFEALIAHDLTFDALVLPRHLTRLHTLLRRYPAMRTVIDHGAKPHIADGRLEPWATEMRRLAEETEVYCKLSGLATEAGDDRSYHALQPYIQHLLECFGYDRLIWGSDWPVATLAIEYQDWLDMAANAVKDATDEQRAALFGGVCSRAYKLSGKAL